MLRGSSNGSQTYAMTIWRKRTPSLSVWSDAHYDVNSPRVQRRGKTKQRLSKFDSQNVCIQNVCLKHTTSPLEGGGFVAFCGAIEVEVRGRLRNAGDVRKVGKLCLGSGLGVREMAGKWSTDDDGKLF